MTLPPYVYALNNSIRNTDTTGAIPDSLRLKMLACLANADISCAMAAWMAYKGVEDAPSWVLFLTNLGDEANRVPDFVQRPVVWLD